MFYERKYALALKGRIVSLRAGSYTVIRNSECGIRNFVCRARGRFRKDGVTPLVGDMVLAEDLGGGEGFITEILPRKNALRRPPLANLDQLFLVCSVTQPSPNPRILDTLIALAALGDIEPALVFTKCDLRGAEGLLETYRAFPCFDISPESDAGGIKSLLAGKVSAFCGNTGVGKTTLLNRLAPEMGLPTGEISQKLGRGRHTTRHAELYPVAGGWVADTPGFGTLSPGGFGTLSPGGFGTLELQEELTKENLAQCFREFAPYGGECRFPDCAHVKDKGCRILEAVAAGEIPRSRWESYAALYTQFGMRNSEFGIKRKS